MKNIFWKKFHTLYLSVSALLVLLSANMKNAISVFYRYRLSLSDFIGIGPYEKKLIGRTLLLSLVITNSENSSSFQF